VPKSVQKGEAVQKLWPIKYKIEDGRMSAILKKKI
jgi:hypothetical protein